jgi:hypothetical protein
METNYDITTSKYVTLVGQVQSGKTIELLNYCYQSIFLHNTSVIFVIRNITDDRLQLLNRIFNYNKLLITKINVKSITDLSNSEFIEFLNKKGVIITLCNIFQLDKIIQYLNKYSGNFNLCIDEVDFSIKTKDFSSKIDTRMKYLKEKATHILGATATPVALFLTEKKMSKIKKLNVNENYKSIESLSVNFVEPVFIPGQRFPACDYKAMNEVYQNCLEKTKCILLHTVVKEKIYHRKLQEHITKKWPKFTTIVYNGDGIVVSCPSRTSNKKLAKKRNYNLYNQFINKYYFIDSHHMFQNYGISEVLQILKDDTEHNHSHITIIAGHLAARGLSFVSSDYTWHLTDQYYNTSNNNHGENLLQSLRILGCYSDSVPLSLWCSEKIWKNIVEQNNLINNLVNNSKDSINWFTKIQEIPINNPLKRLTRPKIAKDLCWNNNGDFYNMKITQPSDQSDSEIN